jgi:hypothetical protein
MLKGFEGRISLAIKRHFDEPSNLYPVLQLSHRPLHSLTIHLLLHLGFRPSPSTLHLLQETHAPARPGFRYAPRFRLLLCNYLIKRRKSSLVGRQWEGWSG